MTHGNAVRYGDGGEDQPDSTVGNHCLFGGFTQPRTRQVAGGDLVTGRNQSDLRPVEIFVGKADCPQHRPGPCLGGPFRHILGMDLVWHDGMVRELGPASLVRDCEWRLSFDP